MYVLAAVAVAVLVGTAVGTSVGEETGTSTLVVADERGIDLLDVPVSEGDEVTVEYTHSVEKTLVTDVYVVDDGTLLMDRMLFSSYGAGLPAQAPVDRDGDRFVYRPPDQRHGRLSVSTGPVAGHELVVGGTRYDLHELADGRTVSLGVERRHSLEL
ncbi:DUF1850 domain-containing protein [Halorubrum cibi]|uniref:DUF1850 domain-containing protein n=1 Tax=Halorubrum cibi TaxID=413815 RepID=A0A521B8L8_9EURY|nr:DUF1850 domain-containing protein [Halorubrum cibi]SMO43419.1 hypothetical protein SAMN06264867_10290 [Halorubrum cibi]